ncbi:CobW family GTP-binding protein [Brevibacillus sp. B_LB10_24]|uniref:CobW family GTP-binding protein n=1 Tax=Brevibacillus sp. B_LB10_24 TaxID=3380645 RepID=UPI0038BB9CE3
MKIVPIIILSGFLGSGKTTFLTRILKNCSNKGIKPAVIMNEVGDVNLDGHLVEEDIPMKEMLSGCICCTISGDLAMEMRRLIDEASPDLILIEATGVANPIEILDTVTEAALLTPIEIQEMITVVDAAHFLDLSRVRKGKTYRLMTDQIRCASILVLNKSDQVCTEELEEIRKIMTELNPFASIVTTAYCDMDEAVWLRMLSAKAEDGVIDRLNSVQQERHDDGVPDDYWHEHDHKHEHCNNHSGHHHSYDHVMVCSHYIQEPINGSQLKRVMKDLPDGVYRAKGIFTSKDTGERVMFQFAYRQYEQISIRPQGHVQDVAVFIGEHFSKHELLRKLEEIIWPT